MTQPGRSGSAPSARSAETTRWNGRFTFGVAVFMRFFDSAVRTIERMLPSVRW